MDPNRVVIGGNTNIFSKEIHEYIISRLEESLTEKPRSFTEIIIDENGLETVAAGVAKAFLNNFVNNYEFAISAVEEG